MRHVLVPSGARAAAAAGVASAAVLLGGCGGGHAVADPAATQPPQAPTRTVTDVHLGDVQSVVAASSFGPGTSEVRITVQVLRFRDHVTAKGLPAPTALASHWASAEVRVCRPHPLVLGYPAWVLSDDDQRTAQEAKVALRGFPTPRFPDTSARTGCAQGWVTWVVPNDLKATKVTFEQTREVPGAWRLR